ncbi:uncharacterized protein E0L32_009731 [Thyridium curvatum]|uniref:Large ribosomal subunit protein bL21m n=1 Tax=Thyridium curvatum TaxID=1093900 RepID=A0A507AV49_9PEZI|nr:uncharacterized protein E0L32_009731 [Thyridium curvatum]TPX08791.1 hypothetical protein E0L32_009731 [Thyridium curvatum]
MSKHILRSALELRAPITRRLFLSSQCQQPRAAAVAAAPLPAARRLFNTTPSHTPSQQQPPTDAAASSSSSPPTTTTTAPTATTPAPSENLRTLLPLLAAQPGGRYATVHVHGRPYLVTQGDSIRLPFRMPGVRPGDVLRLDRATSLGSRDLTLKAPGTGDTSTSSNAPAYVDPSLFECRAVVLGLESEPMRELVKTKRRQRRRKTVRSKHKYTVLRVQELTIKSSL